MRTFSDALDRCPLVAILRGVTPEGSGGHRPHAECARLHDDRGAAQFAGPAGEHLASRQSVRNEVLVEQAP